MCILFYQFYFFSIWIVRFPLSDMYEIDLSFLWFILLGKMYVKQRPLDSTKTRLRKCRKYFKEKQETILLVKMQNDA